MSCLISVRLSVGSSFVLLRGVVGVSVVGPDEVGAETDADFFSVGGSVEMSFAGFLGADASEEDNVGVLFFGRCGEVAVSDLDFFSMYELASSRKDRKSTRLIS